MKRILVIVLVGWLGMGCSSLYTATKEHISRGDEYYQRQSNYRALMEYSKALSEIDSLDDSASGRFVKAALFYHMHLIDAVSLYKNVSPNVQAKHSYLGQMILSDPNIDFLERALKELISVETKPKDYNVEKIEPFLFVEKGLIAGDYLTRVAKQGVMNNTVAHPDSPVPVDFMERSSRYAYLEAARGFYLDAWARVIIVSKSDDPPNNINYLLALCNNRLKNNYSEIIDSLELQPVAGSPQKIEHYKEVLGRINEFSINTSLSSLSFDKTANITLEKVSLAVLNEPLSKGETVLDGAFHLQEMRHQMSRAIEEIVEDKKEQADEYLLNALESLVRTKEFDYGYGDDTLNFLNTTISDIYLNLYRSFVAIKQPVK
ncbi:MAG: hypothetical protein WC980_08605 [Candidatus Brocadiia bacterium]